METPTNSPPTNDVVLTAKKHGGKLKYLFVVILLFLAFYFYSDVVSFFALRSEKSHLEHYKSAKKITSEKFASITSESQISPQTPAEIGSVAYGSDGVVYDTFEDTYYAHRSLVGSQTGFLYVQRFQKDKKLDRYINDELHLPTDPNFDYTGGLGCSSCGCGCYVDDVLMVVGGSSYLIISGKSDAMAPERQGVYFLPAGGTAWERIVPKIDIGGSGFDSVQTDLKNERGFKVFNKGCSIAYQLEVDFYELEVCKSE